MIDAKRDDDARRSCPALQVHVLYRCVVPVSCVSVCLRVLLYRTCWVDPATRAVSTRSTTEAATVGR